MDITTSTSEDLTIISPPPPQQTNNSSWWMEFSHLIRQCYTPNRTDLEISATTESQEDSFHQDWAFASASLIMANPDGQRCVQRDEVVRFICSSGIPVLMSSMQQDLLLSTTTTTRSKAESVSKLLRESVNPRNGKSNRSVAIRQALAADYLNFSVKVLKELNPPSHHHHHHQPSTTVENDEPTINTLWFLSAVAASDSGFASKVRQMLKVKFFHHDLFKKMFFGKAVASHYPLLKLLRILSKHCKVSQTLGKDGIMVTIKKVFMTLNNQPSGKLLILMDALVQFTKDKLNCIRFLKAGLLVKLLRCFACWQNWRGRGLLRLSKSLITVYHHVARTRSGRKALLQSDAVTNIHKFCDQCPAEKAFDEIIMRAAAMISTCYEKDNLPLPPTTTSPIRFQWTNNPLIDHTTSSSSEEDEEGSDDEESSVVDDMSDRSAEEELIPDDMTEKEKSTSGSDEETDDRPPPPPPLPETERQRWNRNILSIDELEDKYKKFFNEFFDQETKPDPTKPSRIKDMPPHPDQGLKHLDPDNNDDSNNNTSKDCWWVDSKDPDLRREYIEVANQVRHVAPFVKIPYPDLTFAYSYKMSETLPNLSADRQVLRNKLMTYISRTAGWDSYKAKVLYSLDNIDQSASSNYLTNLDEKEVGRWDRKAGLKFEARFESGNLRKVIQVGEREYDLLLSPDVNSMGHHQWFYFQVSNVSEDIPYTFNLINCTKANSLFNYGMQPVVFSVTEAVKGRPGWIRSGTNVQYYKNGYKSSSSPAASSSSKRSNYHTLAFTLSFTHKADIVYIAYHIPYTYTRLMVEVAGMLKAVKQNISARSQPLCLSLNQNQVPLITITALQHPQHPIAKRRIIVLTSRVHPGESNASWIMKGILEFLLFDNSASSIILHKFIFKIVPMLNVEGVINGCHRCGLTAEDLNRCWKFPSETQHPSIYHTKMLMEYTKQVLCIPPVLYIDLHGHSRRKNVFFYGCSFAKSWNEKDRNSNKDENIRALAERMDTMSPAFCLNFCNYDVRKSRESTARVAVWRDYDILNSYTLECSYAGCDRGPYKGTAFGTNHLLEIGKNLCQALDDGG